MGRDNAVSIATGYGLDGPGMESRWGKDFLHLSKLALVPTQPPIKWVPGFLPWGKTAGAWRWPPTPSSFEVKERVELYLYSPSVPSWPVPGWTLPLLLANCRYQMIFLHSFLASISIENVPFTVEDTATNQMCTCKEIKCKWNVSRACSHSFPICCLSSCLRTKL